ncbi:MAG TPA: SGNH/GDSL hydrolase family protein [Candidatus Omnitrophota bacterium]|nr:SGNH/GDSL hydrolase family protein [Candidatus Omnitrophota bacterium]
MKNFGVVSFLKNILLFVFVFSICCVLAEIVFLVFFYKSSHQLPPVTIYVHEASPNLKLLYKPLPNAFNVAYATFNKINSSGFRDREYPAQKKPGVRRIIFLGDSVVYGNYLTWDQTIPKQLELNFQKNGRQVEVLNFGVSGYETEQEVEFFKEIGAKFNPDAVIVGYTMNDSSYASLEVDLLHQNNNFQVTVAKKGMLKKWVDFLFNHSRLLQHFDKRLGLRQKFWKFFYQEYSIRDYILQRNTQNQDPKNSAYRLLKNSILADAQRAGLSQKQLDPILKFAGLVDDPLYSSHWNVSQKALLELKALSKKNHFKVYVVIFPYMFDLQQYVLTSVHEFLRREFEKMGFEVIDPLGFVQKLDTIYHDQIHVEPVHFSALGAAALGEYLYKYLSDKI